MAEKRRNKMNQCFAVHEMTRDSADWQEPTSKQMDAHYTVNSQMNLYTPTNSGSLLS